MNWFLSGIQTILIVLLAPLLTGWIRWVKCHLQNRQAPPPWQPYYHLRRLLTKTIILAPHTSIIFQITPYLVASAMILAATAVPFIMIHLPTTALADMIVLAGLFALARFFLALAALDSGTAFGGMGASREMTIAAAAEPALLMIVCTLAMIASSTNLSTVIEHTLQEGFILRPSMLFTLASALLVTLAETGRIPIDNPTTHLELTMIHEAMILEYSGHHLALIEWASQIKLLLYATLLANIFFPFGLIDITKIPITIGALFISFALIITKLLFLAILLAFTETSLAKMRLFQTPAFLFFALLLSLIGLLSYVILETS